jgi:hypothetical protein
MFEVIRKSIVAYNGAGKLSLPIYDLHGISKGNGASPVFYRDGRAEESIENTNPGSYMQQEDPNTNNPDVVMPKKTYYHLDTLDATKSSEENPINHSYCASDILTPIELIKTLIILLFWIQVVIEILELKMVSGDPKIRFKRKMINEMMNKMKKIKKEMVIVKNKIMAIVIERYHFYDLYQQEFFARLFSYEYLNFN